MIAMKNKTQPTEYILWIKRGDYSAAWIKANAAPSRYALKRPARIREDRGFETMILEKGQHPLDQEELHNAE
jgi:hypothetical protein